MEKRNSLTDVKTLRKRARQHVDGGVKEQHADELADLLPISEAPS
jgi:hypothetical protein